MVFQMLWLANPSPSVRVQKRWRHRDPSGDAWGSRVPWSAERAATPGIGRTDLGKFEHISLTWIVGPFGMISLINHESSEVSVRSLQFTQMFETTNRINSWWWSLLTWEESPVIKHSCKKSYDVSRASCDPGIQPSFEDILGAPMLTSCPFAKIFTQMPMKSRSRPAWVERPSAPEAAPIFHQGWDYN